MHSSCIRSEVNRKEYVRFTHFCLGMHKLKLLISKNLCLGVSQRHVSGFTAKFLGVYIRKSSTMSEDGQVHHIAKKGFSESSLYNRVRPSYTRESVEYLLKKLGILNATGSENMAQTVLELGAGTGKFTRVMADILRENGNAEDERVRIIATEPLASMKEKFCELCPGIEVLQCPAENIAIQDSSVNAVIAAQSFHWFANQKSLKEIHRILTPEGHFAIFWYRRDRSVSWVDKIDEVVDRFYERDNVPRQRDINWQKEFLDFGKFGPMNSNCSFCWSQEGDARFYVDRFMSISPVASSTDEEKEMFVRHVKTVLAEEHRKTGKNTFILPYTTEIYWFKKH